MVEASYSTQAVADLIANPQDRSVPIRAAVEKMGGKLEVFYYAFGDSDIIVIADMPDNTAMAALAMAVAAGGAVRSFKTTVLMTIEDGMEAMRRAGGTGYQPPR